uniref:G-protein coupled receptors family 1 profile domain-containing protein n=1 Tax=Moschus moschiferus TaxID=68415 RepID=A0A8C6E4J1_MOSMO
MATFHRTKRTLENDDVSTLPSLEWAHPWNSLPICVGYLVALLGNATILHWVRTDPFLHLPMYYFLDILAVTDLGLCLSSVLGALWLEAQMVDLVPCVLQQGFLHSSFVDSAVLFAMVLDSLVAIHFSLHYASMLTGPCVALVRVLLCLPSAVITTAPSLHLLKFDYCHRGALSYAYCLQQDMIHLTGSDTHFNRLYGLCTIMLAMGSDVLFILLSYTIILSTVLAIASAGERFKAFNTCVSHLLAVLCFSVHTLGLSIVHRFGSHTSPLVHTLWAMSLIKTKEIRRGIYLILSRKSV